MARREHPAGTFGITQHPFMAFDEMDEARDFIAAAKARDPLGLGDRLRLVLGDIDAEGEHPQFWVAREGDAARLVQAGYQYGDAGAIERQPDDAGYGLSL